MTHQVESFRLISISRHLQVLLDKAEFQELRRTARRQRMTVAEWVRQALRGAPRREPGQGAEHKLAAVRAAVRHEFPTAEIDRMLAKLESGYLGAPDR